MTHLIDGGLTTAPDQDSPDAGALHTFPVIAESVTVHKHLADNGGLRLRKIVHADMVEVDEELSTQSVNVIRKPIGRDVEGPVEIRYENGVTIIPVVEERLIVRRQLVLVEEIHVSRSSHIARIPQSVSVRREEIIVERQDPGQDTWHLEGDSLDAAALAGHAPNA